jgi:hypothetical protein
MLGADGSQEIPRTVRLSSSLLFVSTLTYVASCIRTAWTNTCTDYDPCSKIPVFWDATQRNIPEDWNPRLHLCENHHKLAQYTSMGRLTCDVAGDLETLSVGLEPLQIKATRSFETSGTYAAATTQRHMPALKTW